MAQTSTLELLRRLRETLSRTHVLELADIDRQIKELSRSKPVARQTQPISNAHTERLLKVMQAAKEPLPPREIAQRLDRDARTVSRWLAAAKRMGYVERVDRARYRVVEEVPPL